MNVNLNPREQHVLKSIMRAFNVTESNPVYWDLATKVIQNQLVNPINTIGANSMLMSIAEKIAYAKISEEIDDILAEANEIDLESTKAQSFKKVKSFSERHQQVLSMINKYPKSSRRELAAHLGWSINRVTPRIKELLEMNKIKVAGTKYDEKTERNVESLEIV